MRRWSHCIHASEWPEATWDVALFRTYELCNRIDSYQSACLRRHRVSNTLFRWRGVLGHFFAPMTPGTHNPYVRSNLRGGLTFQPFTGYSGVK